MDEELVEAGYDEPTVCELVERLTNAAEEYNDEASEETAELVDLLTEAAETLEGVMDIARKNWIDLAPDAEEVRLSEVQQLARKWGWTLELRVIPG